MKTIERNVPLQKRGFDFVSKTLGLVRQRVRLDVLPPPLRHADRIVAADVVPSEQLDLHDVRRNDLRGAMGISLGLEILD